MNPIVRPTGILIQNGKILLIKQELAEQANWTLPGGALEFGETIEQCLLREMKEETGLEVEVKELLYICDRFHQLNKHVVDMTFLVEKTGGELLPRSFERSSNEVIKEIKMVPIDEIPDYGFSQTFYQLVKGNFPGKGNYQGDFNAFYGKS